MSRYLRFIKIEHTLFSLPIVFAGTFLALFLGGTGRMPRAAQTLWIFLAVLGARAAGFGLNRVIDKSIDRRNPRTAAREIPSGQIPVSAAWTFIAISCAIFFFAAAMLSRTCLALAPIPILLFATYPFLKRFTRWAHLGLGVAWGIAPLGGWLAVRPQITPWAQLAPALLLAAFCILWVAGFDVVYALLDEEFDRAQGLHSLPAALGAQDALRVARLLHLAAFAFLGTLVQLYLNGPASFLLLAACGLVLAASHWKVAFNPLTPAVVDFAFFKANAVLGFLVFGIVLLGGLK